MDALIRDLDSVTAKIKLGMRKVPGCVLIKTVVLNEKQNRWWRGGSKETSG